MLFRHIIKVNMCFDIFSINSNIYKLKILALEVYNKVLIFKFLLDCLVGKVL